VEAPTLFLAFTLGRASFLLGEAKGVASAAAVGAAGEMEVKAASEGDRTFAVAPMAAVVLPDPLNLCVLLGPDGLRVSARVGGLEVKDVRPDSPAAACYRTVTQVGGESSVCAECVCVCGLCMCVCA
jgi:hypothetical protein